MADEQIKGVPEGVTAADLNPGEVTGGDGVPKAPVINNVPPVDAIAATEEETFDDPNKKVEPPVEKTAEETGDKSTEDEPTEYTVYDDPSADAIVDMLKEGGLTPAESNAIFAEAIDSGDLSKIDVAKLVEKLGKTKADMVMLAAQDYYTRTVGKTLEITKAVFDELGGEKNWQTIAAWSKTKQETDPAFKAEAAELNAMLELGKTAALLATRTLVERYNSDPKNKTLTMKMVTGTSSGNAASTDPISRDEYLAAYKVAAEKGDTAEMNRLNAQRSASRKL